ncbi:cellobiose phosphorylase [Lachnospiraceae bacterium 42-17]|jgi:cellobiose phosphorylase
MNNQIYKFSEHGESCLIYDAKPPRYWFNYLWNENGYCAQISQIGHGRSYYLNEKADMCMLNNNDARYLYIRDDVSKECWNIGAGPLDTKVQNYRCKHSIGYSDIQSDYSNIHSSWRFFVPQGGYHEVWEVTVCNHSDRDRKLSLFSAVTFELEGFSYPRYYEMYRCIETEFDRELNGIYCVSSHPFAPHKRYNAFLSSSEPVYAYDGDLAKFCGETGSITKTDASAYALFQRPKIVTEGMDCTNSSAALFILGGVLQQKFVLRAGEEKKICFVFGVSESIEEARDVSKKIKNPDIIEEEFQKTRKYNLQKYASLSVKTPDEKINHIMNLWLKKQIDCCIVGKKGVRDNLQIAVALLNYRPEKAKEEILECLRHQFQDGHTVLTWYPYDDTRYSDQPFWIIWAVCELLKETGDFGILAQEISWQDGETASVLEHMKAAVNRLIQDKGRNGLVKIYFADWNDALNITTDPEAESVMLSHQFCLALREMKRLMEKTGEMEYANYLEKEYQILKKQINDVAWDGDWYMRALSKEENIGSKYSEGSKIYLNAQTWAVLADVVDDEERLQKLVKSVDDMEYDFGFPLNLPPYLSYSPHVGRMSGMLAGLFENGGVYCHATGFKILMDCKMKRGTKAVQTLKKIMPDSEYNPSSQSGAEPYVFTNCYSTHPKYYGKSYWSWTTGTSAWAMMGLYEGILGVKRDYSGLKIEPAFPAEWSNASMTRHFRNADYHITICNPGHVEGGKPVLTIDHKKIVGNIIPSFEDGKIHEVEVTLR